MTPASDSEPTFPLSDVCALCALDDTRALQATAKHLAAVESAEEIVRLQLGLTPEDTLRVRMVSTIPSARVSLANRLALEHNCAISVPSWLGDELQSKLTIVGSSKRRELALTATACHSPGNVPPQSIVYHGC